MCDSDKEVEDIKTEENVENDEASTEGLARRTAV